MKASLAVAICFAALALPSGAAAINCAPPGNSGISQYLETVPGDSCSAPSTGSSGRPGGSLPAATRRRLASQGAPGLAVERLASSAAPSEASGAATPGTRSQGARSIQLASDSGRDVIAGVLQPILSDSGPGGLGVGLPLLLAATLGAVTATLVARRRRSR